ncbi:MAG: hypothetical protein ACPG4F_09880, partial [Paracoccaceae bacterium]
KQTKTVLPPPETDAERIADLEAQDEAGQKEVSPASALKTKLATAVEAKVSEEEASVGSIDLRLQEYERRLAEAKQTATKLWH